MLTAIKQRIIACVLLNLLFFLCMDVFSQDPAMQRGSAEAPLPVVIPPSPNSAVLMRTVSENVDLYTGILSIDLPLYTFKTSKIELPVSLQTTANSHRVNDIATWVGLGWNLNAGGKITRVMKNLPDEFNGTISSSFNFWGVGYLNIGQSPYNVDIRRFHPAPPGYTEYTVDEMKTIIDRGAWNSKNDPPGTAYDLQPDEFYFNFGKHSGKFVFDQTGKVRAMLNEANMIITPTIANNKITAFTVYTDDGYRYDFGNYSLNAVEETKMTVKTKPMLYTYRYTGCSWWANLPGVPGVQAPLHLYQRKPYVMSGVATGSSGGGVLEKIPEGIYEFANGNLQKTEEYPQYPSTWYLTKITAPGGDEVNLMYTDNGQLTYVADRSATGSTPVGITEHSSTQGLPCTINWNGPQPPYFTSFATPEKKLAPQDFWHYPTFGNQTMASSIINVSSKRLTEISNGAGYKILFSANTSRIDFLGDKRLDQVTVEYNGQVIKRFDFAYENIESTEPYVAPTYDVFRPKYVYNNQGGYIGTEPYPVTISETLNDVDTDIRYRMYLTSVQEKGANNEVIPAYQFEYNDRSVMPYRTSYSQDLYGFAKDGSQQVSLTKLLSGVLKKITYPTGGYKQLTYEFSGNTSLWVWNGLRIKNVKEYESPNGAFTEKNYTYGQYLHVDYMVQNFNMTDIITDYIGSNNQTYKAYSDKTHLSNSRSNHAATTRGVAGGYNFVEVSQPGNGKYRAEFTTSSVHGDEGTSTYRVSSYVTPNVTSLNNHFPFPQATSGDARRGLLEAEYWKKEDGTNIKSSHYEYDYSLFSNAEGLSTGLHVSKTRIDRGTGWNWLLFGRYEHRPRWLIMSRKKDRTYSPNGLTYMETVQELTYKKAIYNSQKEMLFTDQVKLLSNSKNEQVIEKFRYPLDYSQTWEDFGSGISRLKTDKVLNAVVEQYKYVQDQNGNNRRYISGLLNKFDANKPLVKRTYSFQPATTTSTFTESFSYNGTFSYDGNYRPIINFNAFDNLGNILEQQKENDVKESYVWDYGSMLPIAKATNASSDRIAFTSFEADGLGGWSKTFISFITSAYGFTGKKCFNGTLNKTVPSGNYVITLWARSNGFASISGAQTALITTVGDWNLYEFKVYNTTSIQINGQYIDEVRLYPQGAQMTSYTFSPLVGMTSQNDPNNRVTFYEYDELARLKIVRDQNKNVIKTYEYNYKQ